MSRERGVRARTAQDGTVTYEANFKVKGQKRVFQGGFATDDEALEWRIRSKREAKQGRLVLPESTTFKTLFDRWIRAAKAEGEWSEYTEAHHRGSYFALGPKWGSRIAAGIKPLEIAEWLVELAESKLAARTRQGYRGTMAAVYRWAVRMEILVVNPLEKVTVKVKRGQQKKQRALTLYETRLYLIAERRHAAVWRFMLLTGLRRAETFRMTWDWLNLDEGVLYVMRGKCGYAELPLAPSLVEMFRELKKSADPKCPYVFSPNGKPLRWDGPMRAAFKAAGITGEDELKGLGHHTDRRTFATLLEDVPGVKPSVIRDLLRHSSGEMSDRYKLPPESDLHKAIRGLEKLIWGPAELPENHPARSCGRKGGVAGMPYLEPAQDADSEFESVVPC